MVRKPTNKHFFVRNFERYVIQHINSNLRLSAVSKNPYLVFEKENKILHSCNRKNNRIFPQAVSKHLAIFFRLAGI